MSVNDTVLNLEKQYWEAVKNLDGEAAKRLTAKECVVSGPNGVQKVNRNTIPEMVTGGQAQIRDYRIDAAGAQVLGLGEDVAIISYPVHEKIVTDGKETTLDAFDSSVWVRNDGEWVCAMHTEAIAEPASAR